jgi:hypothetical protein
MSRFVQKARYVDIPSIVVILIAIGVPLFAILL